MTQLDSKTCKPCGKMHGKIYATGEVLSIKPPIHPFCRCEIRPMDAVVSGYATEYGTFGADFWLKQYGRLPDNYVTKEIAEGAGWIPKEGNLRNIFPKGIIGGNIYVNRDGHLPTAIGRIWYEADINYEGAYRGVERVLYSNDGLVFVTYDHYDSFLEVI